ncbi:MAG TPA: hypothetical protein VK474_08105, partial [Chthoniobacterales bacterium]|nr:hypothetical protein [Chthoniobacterales bacterium]
MAARDFRRHERLTNSLHASFPFCTRLQGRKKGCRKKSRQPFGKEIRLLAALAATKEGSEEADKAEPAD